MNKKLGLLVLGLLGFQLAQLSNAYSEGNWMDESNKIAIRFAEDFARTYDPDFGSSLGVREFDTEAYIPSLNRNAKLSTLYSQWLQELDKKLQTPDLDPNLRLDIEILQHVIRQGMEELKIHQQLKVITFNQASQHIFNSLLKLINPQSPPERKRSAVDRFHSFLFPRTGEPSYIDSAIMMLTNEREEFGDAAFYPYVDEVEDYLKNSPVYLKGIEELLAQSGRDDYQADLTRFKEQLKNYDAIVTGVLLSHSRKSPILPDALYQLELKKNGVESSADDLIRRGQAEFQSLFRELQTEAQRLAEQMKLPSSDVKSVILALKAKNVRPRNEELVEFFRKISEEVDALIRTHNLITLPPVPTHIRLADRAESEAAPFVHVIEPPILNNSGERPEMVLPVSVDGYSLDQDADIPYAAFTLMAHELHPGHGLQIAARLGKISLIRSVFAENAANLEGWAMYSEKMIMGYLPPGERRLGALQSLAFRAARMYLDPMVQSGRASEADVIRIYDELGISEEFAKGDSERMHWRFPGQATSYYFGLLHLLDTKTEVAKVQGSAFSDRWFNDEFISLGSIHLDLCRQEIKRAALVRSSE